VKVLDYARG